MPRTLVTGGSGFIGSQVTRLLVERGDDVTVLVRGTGTHDSLERLGVRVARGDVTDRSSLRRALRGVARLFHVAGTADLTLSRPRTISLNAEGTRIVLEEALRAGVERAVLTSSAAAAGPAPAGLIADERTIWDAGRYAIPFVDSKHAAEVEALGLVARGLPLVIVNPTYVLGPGDRGRSSTTLVLRFLRRQIPAYVNGTLNIVGVDDVARGHLLADERGEVGERYILANRNFTLDRLFADLGRLSGVEPPPLKLSLPIALALAAGAERIRGMRMPTAVEVRASAQNWAYSNAKARRALGWRPAPHEDCLEETIAWYRERYGDRVGAPGSRQALPLRAVGGVVRRIF